MSYLWNDKLQIMYSVLIVISIFILLKLRSNHKADLYIVDYTHIHIYLSIYLYILLYFLKLTQKTPQQNVFSSLTFIT